MKKIMKKALSLALALVMMLSLAPMTTNAAIDMGAGTSEQPYEMGSQNDTTVALEWGQQTYFQYNTWSMDVETFKVTVEGEGNFAIGAWDPFSGDLGDVNTSTDCEGDGSISVASVSHPMNGNCFVFFYIVNLNNTGSGVYDVTIEVDTGASAGGQITGDGSMNTPYDITNALNNVPVLGYGESAYYQVTGLEGGAQYSVTVSAGMMGGSYQLLDANGENPADSVSMGPSVSANITVTAFYASGSVVFMISNTNLGESGPFRVSVEKIVEDPIGSVDRPDTLEFGTGKTQVLTSDQYLYYYEWTATQDGYFTVEFDDDACEDGWVYSVQEKDYSFEGIYCESGYDEDPEDWETEYHNPGSVGVFAGETVVFMVGTAAYDAGTVTFDVTFTPGEVIRQEDIVEFEDITKYNTELEMELPVYSLYVKEDIAGTQTVPINQDILFDVPMLYQFVPTEAGVYEITVSDGVIGFYGNNLSSLTDPTSMTNKVEVTITNVGQTAYVGVSDTVGAEVTLTIIKKASVQEKPSSTTYEEAKYDKEPAKYTFTGNADLLTYIEVEDDVVDKAVLGSDGYYHLNSVDGPILLVKLDGQYGSAAPFVTAKNNALKGIDASGKGWDYSKLYMNYASVADKDTMLYPLNDDLMEIYKIAGKAQGWYTASLGGVETEDAWMFNCYYVPNAVKVEVPADKVVTEETLDEAIKEAIEQELPLVVETTTEGVTLTFAVEDLKDAEAVKLNVEVKLNVDVKDETVAKNDKITDKNFVMKIEFSHDGKLPAKATITIPVPVAFAGKTLYYYEILADGTLKYVCDAPVDANGIAKVKQDHCSDYVLLTEKVDAPLAEEIESPDTGDSANFALWVAVLGLGVVAMAGSVVMKKREF